MEIIYYDYRDTKKNGVTVRYPNPQFKSINKLRMSGENVRTLIQYKGSDEELVDLTDYNEYGWKYLVNKFGVNNEFNLNYLLDKDIVGRNMEDIYKVNKTFLPTISNKDPNRTILDDIEDYGLSIGGHNVSILSIQIDDEEAISTGKFNVNNGALVKRLTLKESGTITFEVEVGDDPEIVLSTNGLYLNKIIVPDDGSANSTSVSIKVIDLFPEEISGYFGTVLVGDQSLMMVKIPRLYSDIDFIEDNEVKFTIKFTNNDIQYTKIVWFVVTSGGIEKISDINLSRLSWEQSKNPHRNIKNYLLSYKDKQKIDLDPNVCSNTWGDVWMDLSSGTLLGNAVIENPVLYNSLVEKYSKVNTWDKNVKYSSGYLVEYQDKIWESLSNNNLGNIPTYSNEWAISESILNIRAKKIYLSCTTTEGGLITPGSFVKPRPGQSNMVPINIVYNSGYILDLGRSSTLYNQDTPLSSENIQLLNFRAHKFNKGKLSDNIKLSTTIDNPIIEFKEYSSKVDITKLSDAEEDRIINLEGDFTVDEITTKSTELNIAGNSRFSIRVNPGIIGSQKYVESVKQYYMIGGNSVHEETVDFETEGRNIIINGFIDAPADIRYFLNIQKRFYMAYILDYTGFYINSTSDKIIDKESTVFRLYPVDDDFTSPIYLKLGESEEIKLEDHTYSNDYNPNNSVALFKREENHYELIVTGGSSNGNSLSGDINIKIWR